MITAQNLIYHEFIGLEVSVRASLNPSLISISGHIIDETRQMLVIQPYEKPTSKKMVVKRGTLFQFTLPDGGLVDVDGDVICAAPHRRIGMKGVK